MQTASLDAVASVIHGEWLTAKDVARLSGVGIRTVRRALKALLPTLENRSEIIAHQYGGKRTELYRKRVGEGSMEEIYAPQPGCDTSRLAACLGGHSYINRAGVVHAVFPEMPSHRMRERFCARS